MRGLVVITASVYFALLFSPTSANADELYLPDANGCKVYDPSPKPNETVTWSGRCLDGYADGSGVVQWLQGGKPGTRVEVALVRGKSEGKGSTVSPSGARFEGTFREGERSGKGIWTGPNGDRYEGDWLHDLRTGAGILTRANGDRYEGDFVDGKWSGHGTFTSAAGERYSGDWLNNKREGKGEEIWADGSSYTGKFVNDLPVDPKLVVRKVYSIKEYSTGSVISKAVVKVTDVPPDKGYGQLTAQQQRIVRSLYESMADDDVPPYPLHGPQEIFQAAARVQKTLRVTGEMTLAVTISSKGEPLDVQVLRSPSSDVMVKTMAQILLLEKYTPASCKGVPCQMQFPVRFRFDLQ
jgi:hypothetical protein